MKKLLIEESVKKSAELKWKDILENGKRFNGISSDMNPEKPPLWFNEIKFLRAQQLAHKYYNSLLWGQIFGLIVVLNHSEAVAPLLITGNSSTVPKLFRRYLSTIIHVKYWYEYKPFDQNSKSFKSLSRVRGMHRQIAKQMNVKCNRIEGRDNLWIPQYGMTHAQFAFIGMVALFPNECGLHTISHEDFDCLLYFWRVIGHCLGIDDRFNLCSGSVEETVELCGFIFWKEWYPLINAEIPEVPVGVEMGKGICLAMNSVNNVLNYNVIMKYWYPILNVSKSVKLQSIQEYFNYYFVKIHFKYFTKLSIFNLLASFATRISIAISIHLKERKHNRLIKQYQNISYENNNNNNLCPFDVDFNYSDVFKIETESTKL